MLKGFQDFILRGNVVDLAVGVVIGAAFSGIITAFSAAFLNPLIKLATGGGTRVGGAFVVNNVTFDYGTFITAIINFILIAAVIYFLVVTPMNHLTTRFKRQDKPPVAEPSNEEKLLAEIRDALRAGGGLQPPTAAQGEVRP
ncbi:large conductance mechanosensitive channel protein MscL [Deinococcus sp. QL22]|uniref:large conductance mechanosensitive channel protein MscL n=1 Tax=Deinococcus sp. QL22 TaxID=2939437 RepID=UPI002016E92B|nr:large conductance mechanosensitive channel protein MscL [Deinococcus sp. QL22]UQN07991.1 large conductance mechanosensitive channel protein MscL [Deinococcus sp. QL22]